LPPTHAGFLADLAVVYDSEIDKDPSEWVPVLASIFATRRVLILESRRKFLADLHAVCQAEGTKDPEDFLPILAVRLAECRNHNVQLMREHLTSLPDDDPLRCPISLFGTLGLGRLETAHSSALAWLLDPRRAHGLGTNLVEALLGYLAKSKADGNLVVDNMLSEHRVDLGSKSLGRMDIFGTGRWTAPNGSPGTWLLAIEAKIDASEGERQLDRYDRWIDAHRGNRAIFRVYLTPEGRRAESEGTDWTPLSFLDLVRVFRGPYIRLRQKPGFHFLRYYLTGILMDICRWELPVGAPESCEDPYGFVDYLKTVRTSN
jgi:hypothetical protein